MKYDIYVDGVKGAYSKSIDTSVTPQATLGRTSRDNNPHIPLEFQVISRKQGTFYVVGEKLMYSNTGQIVPTVINGNPIDPNSNQTEMNLETILNFGDMFRVARRPLSYQASEEEDSSEDGPTMEFPKELYHLLKKD